MMAGLKSLSMRRKMIMIKERIEDFWYDFKRLTINKVFRFLGYEPIIEWANSEGLALFDDSNPCYITIEQIVVPSEFDKAQLLLAFEYLHDNRLIDTDLMAVNTIVHLYEQPDIIVVKDTSVSV